MKHRDIGRRPVSERNKSTVPCAVASGGDGGRFRNRRRTPNLGSRSRLDARGSRRMVCRTSSDSFGQASTEADQIRVRAGTSRRKA